MTFANAKILLDKSPGVSLGLFYDRGGGWDFRYPLCLGWLSPYRGERPEPLVSNRLGIARRPCNRMTLGEITVKRIREVVPEKTVFPIVALLDHTDQVGKFSLVSGC